MVPDLNVETFLMKISSTGVMDSEIQRFIKKKHIWLGITVGFFYMSIKITNNSSQKKQSKILLFHQGACVVITDWTASTP